MKCEEAASWFGVYRDLPDSAPERIGVDIHIAGCPACAEEFRLWEESAELIKGFPLADETEERNGIADSMNRKVMDRIYTEQSWYMPAVRRTYAFTNAFRRKVALMLAGLLSLFGCAFLYTAWNRLNGGDGAGGVIDSGMTFASLDGMTQTVEVPTASLGDPVVLHVSPAMPEYWVALSMLGVIMMLLTLNWFSRVRV